MTVKHKYSRFAGVFDMYKYIFPTVACAAALFPACAAVSQEEAPVTPNLHMICHGTLQCNGVANFIRKAGGDDVHINMSFAKKKLERYIVSQLNAKAFPQKVDSPSFTVQSIRAADIQLEGEDIIVTAQFETVGDLAGQQKVTMKLKNGATGEMVFPVEKGTLNFELAGTYKSWPAYFIPKVMLGDARTKTEKMVSDLLAKNLSKQKIFSYLDAPHSKLKAIQIRLADGRVRLGAKLNLPKRGSDCAFAWAQAYKQISLAGHASMTIAAENWDGGLSATGCDVAATK